MKSRSWLRTALAAVLLTACASIGRAADDAATAKAIEAASGVRAGLCLHLGCGREGSAGLSAALAAGSDGLAVHGLAFDEAARARAQAAIDAAKLQGRAMVERADCAPLPYVNDLANLIVVEDMAGLQAAGVTREEMLRVLAPGGVLCIKDKDAWTKTVKPRPKEMDEWTHPNHGPDGNRVSADGIVAFPTGVRWVDGLPYNIHSWADTRGWVLAGGRCFSFSAADFENFGVKRGGDMYLTARDAFNGIPLWKMNCGPSTAGSESLNWRNAGPLVADGERVYVVQKNKVVIFAAASGKILGQCEAEFAPAKMLLADGALLVASWEGSALSAAKTPEESKVEGAGLWGFFHPKTAKGSVEAFEPETGKRKWTLPLAASVLLASDGVAYALLNTGNPPTAREVVAIDLKAGKEKWRVPHTQFGPLPDLQLNVAGPGYLVVAKAKDRAIFVLAADSGKELWKIQPAKEIWTPVVEGLLWNGDKKYNPLTGEVKGSLPFSVGPLNNVLQCQPSYMVGKRYSLNGVWGVELPPEGAAGAQPKKVGIGGARMACLQGVTPANGMFYMAQNRCGCVPEQILGFRAFGPATAPTAADFAKARPVEKGPAFGAADEPALAASDWPSYRHDAERSAATSGEAPADLTEVWRTPLSAPAEGLLGKAWQARLSPCLSAPVVAGGRVFVAVPEEGRVVALEAESGKKSWTVSLGARVDAPPTIHGGLCLTGCRDGWVYALRAKDGVLAWRTRVAPRERRMVAHGQVESVWPVVGPVLVKDEVAFASAGRSVGADGGLALTAFNARTGEPVWARAVTEGGTRNDILVLRSEGIGLGGLRFNPASGTSVKPAPAPAPAFPAYLDGWRMDIGRDSMEFWIFPLHAPALLAWDSKLLATPAFAITTQRVAQPGPFKKEDLAWQIQLPWGARVESTTMAAGTVIYAGRVSSVTPNCPIPPIGDPKVNAAAKGNPTGFVKAVSAADGKTLTEVALDSPATFDGVAIAGGRIYVSLRSGALLCLGKKPGGK